MSALSDLYLERGVPEGDRVRLPKNVVITVPSKDFDVAPALGALGVSKFEINVLWPKPKLNPDEEALFIRPRIVIQLGQSFSCRYPFIPEGQLPDAALRARVQAVLPDHFVNLHHHDEFSLQDGLGTAAHLGDLLQDQRRSFLCVTNHGSVGGWIKQYNVCRALGLKCIFGMEAYIENYRGDDDEERKKHRSANHLILIARTKEGFDNLIRIHNDAQLKGFYYSPRVNWDAIKKWGKGIVGTSACAAGEVARALMVGDEALATQICQMYVAAFDQFYIELPIIEMEEQREINRRLILLAAKLGIGTVLSCDSHYLDATHAETHSLLMYIRQKKTIKEVKELDKDVWDFDVLNLYYRNAAQMAEPFRNGFVTKDGVKRAPFLDDVFTEEVFQRSMATSRRIAVEVDDISLDSQVKLPKMYPDSSGMLREKVHVGFKKLGLNLKSNKADYEARVRYEFEVITRMGLADYFLIMEKIITEARARYGEWAVGYGRGSAAGCLVSWCLGLTDCDPLKYGLLFERFFDESRKGDLPDIDTDFDPRIRDEVKKYIVETFGEDNTCAIGTYGSYKTRAVILDIARVLGLDYHEASELTKSLELKVSVENEEGEEEEFSIDKVDFDELIEQFADLRLYFETHPEVLVHARLLRNQVRHMSTHAGGVIISDLALKDRIPVFEDKDGRVVSCWNESGNSTELSNVGLVKFDILGLNNLCVVGDCVKLIAQNQHKVIERWEIPIDDREAIRMGSKRDLVGIFQFENPGVKPVVEAVGMDCLEDVAAITSLIRPGPKDMGMDMEYAKRKHGEPYSEVECLRTLLADTYGVMVYQEQVMRIARELAGFTMAEANKLRKGMGKKKKDVIAALKDKFMKGAQKAVDEGRVTQAEVDTVFLKIASFAKYGFNKSVDNNTEVIMVSGEVKRIRDIRPGELVWCFDGERFVQTDVLANHDHGVLPAFEVMFDDGATEVCSWQHKFLTRQGQRPLGEIVTCGYEVMGHEGLSMRRMQCGGTRVKSHSCPSRPVSASTSDCQCSPGRSQSTKRSLGEGEASTRVAQAGVAEGRARVCERPANPSYPFCYHEQIECRPRFPRENEEDSFRDRETDLGSARCAGAAGGETCSMEEVSSRRLQAMHDSRPTRAKVVAVQGRRLAVGQRDEEVGVQSSHSSALCEHRETGRFRTGWLLGGGGWLLAFRNGVHQEEILSRPGSQPRPCSYPRGDSKGDCSHSRGTRLLARVRSSHHERRMAEHLHGCMDCSSAGSLSPRKVLHARFVGERHMRDLEVSHPAHNFMLASGIVTSNSHAITYSALTCAELWLKYHYPLEYITALLNNTSLGKKKFGEELLPAYINYARKRGFKVLGPDINQSGEQFTIEDGKIRFPIGHIKNVATATQAIIAGQPYKDMADFYERAAVDTVNAKGETKKRRINKKVVDSLIAAGAFDCFGTRADVMRQYYACRKDKEEVEMPTTDKQWQEKEEEMIGLCLSIEPLRWRHEKLIVQNHWCTIDGISERGRTKVFGRISSVLAKTSQKGNQMLVVTLTDDLDTMKFFVFGGSMIRFKEEFKTGDVAAIPMKKFDESETRFYDVDRDGQMVERKGV